MTNNNQSPTDETNHNHPIPSDIVERVCKEHTIYTDAPPSLTIEQAHETLTSMQADVHEHLPDTLETHDVAYEDDDTLVLYHDSFLTQEDARYAGLDDSDAIGAIWRIHNLAAKKYLPKNALAAASAYVIKKQ